MFFSVFSAANPVIAAEVQELTTVNTEENTETENITQEDTESESSESEPQIIGEDESRRTADTKHFIMSDGSRKAVVYGNAVHYEKDDKWNEIDNTLIYDNEKNEYKNNRNSFKATFKENFGEENLFSLENKGYTISWEYKSNFLRKNLIKAEYKNKEKIDDKITQYAQQSEDRITYKNFDSNCELEYVVIDKGVKENIILNSKTNKNEFTFNVTANDLTLSKESDGSIIAKNNNNEEIFYIPAPFMYDSNNVYSYDVNYELSGHDGVYKVTVVADKLWLNDDARKYPVIIDPVIYTKQSSTSVSSTFIASDTPTTNYGSRQDMYVGVESACYGNCYAMFKNTLPDLEKGDMVTGANLSVYLHDTSFDGGSSKRTLDAHIITSAWSENSVTWDTKPNFNSTVIDYCFMNDGDEEWKKFDITKAVKGWYEGTFSNYGILIKSHDESLIPARAIIRSENATNITEGIPVISIDYRNNKGLEGYWSFSSFSAGTGGAGYVNDYSGNLVYQIPLMSTVSEIMPVSLSLVYNGYAAGMVHSSGINGSFRTTPGKGWKFNIQETVISSEKYGLKDEAAEQYPFVYTDGDGTEHYFVKTTEKDKNGNEKTVYKDEDGLGLELEKVTDGTATYKITDKQDNVRLFNAKGNLGIIKNSNGKQIQIKYKDTNGDEIREKDKIDKIIDGAGHTLTFDYYGEGESELDYVLSVKDNADRTVVLNTASGYLNSVSYYDGTQTYIGYEKVAGADTGLINYVWTTDGIGLNFDYTSEKTGYRVEMVKEFAATDVGDEYENLKDGQITTFDRSRYNTTVIRTPGIDGIHKVEDTNNENDDIVTTLQFDNRGNPTSQQVSYGNGGEVGAGSYNYENNKEGSKNKITDAASLGKNTVNLLKNGNAESLSYWSAGKTGTVTTDNDVVSERYTGNHSILLNTTAISGDGSNNYLGQSINGTYTAGYYYTFSAFVKTYNLVQKGSTGYKGAYIQISAYNSSGTNLGNVYSQPLTADTNTDINNGWRRLSATIEIPEGTTSLGAYLCLRNATGKAYFDCMQLELSTTPNSVNLLENSGFESSSSGLPTNWSLAQNTNKETDSDGNVITGISTQNKRQGSNALRISGEADAYKGFYQSIPVEGNENDTYIVSGWAAAFAVNSTYHSHYQKNGQKVEYDPDDDDIEYVEDSKFEIAVRVTYTKTDEKGATSTVTQYKDPAKFNTTIATWQYAVTPICLKYETTASDKATYTPTHIMIMPRYNLQANYAFFDHLQLIKDVAQSYVYDSEGNLISVTKNAEQKDNITYDGENNVETYTDAIGCKTSFKYETNTHNLQTVTTPKGVQTSYTYNDAGQVIATEKVGNDGKKKIKTENEYYGKSEPNGISAGAYLRFSYDANGNPTTYTYDWKTGTPLTVKDANGVITQYGYTDNNYSRPLSVVTAGATDSAVYYDYEENTTTKKDTNRISSITFGDKDSEKDKEVFSFVYDAYGNKTQNLVGGVTLSTNIFAENNGVLTQTEYGNGDGIKYAYDNSGNITKEYHKNAAVGQTNAPYYEDPMYSWLYSSNGTPRLHSDGINSLKYAYSYDSIGRLIRTDISSSSGSYVGSTEYGYDPRGNMTSIQNEIGGVTYTQSHIYAQTKDENDEVIIGTLANSKDGLPTRYSIFSNRYADYYYDSLSRRTMRKFRVGTTDDPVFLYNLYTYKDSQRNASGSDTYQTTLLESETVAGTAYAYKYDKVGNITEITRNDKAYHSYQYDKFGQLVRDDSATGGTYTWTYDDLGNITSRKKYAYTTGDISSATPSETIEYHYGKADNAGWNNILTGVDFNGNGMVDETEKILYDEIGNPTTYLGANMWWKGRQLTSYRKDGVDLLFTYDASGLRGSKTVKGTKTTYQYVDGKLYYENRGNGKELYYFYDSFNNLSAISYFNGKEHTMYYALTNLQGDVLGLYDAWGKKVAAYDYDSWGNATVYEVTQDENGNNVHTVVTEETDHISYVNPIRYRGYYYDSDLGLYYLQSRYYDSTVGRFINADGYVTTGQGVLSYNMFVYCLNNPVLLYDPNGNFSRLLSLFKNFVRKTVSVISADNSGSGFFEDFLNKLISPREKGNTFSFGVSYGYSSGGVSGNKSKVLSVDTSYNYALQETISSGSSTGVGGSAGLLFSYTNAPNVEDLNDISKSWGGTFASSVGLSVDFVRFSSATIPDKEFYGFDVVISIGAEAEVHKQDNMTTTTDIWRPIRYIKERLYG